MVCFDANRSIHRDDQLIKRGCNGCCGSWESWHGFFVLLLCIASLWLYPSIALVIVRLLPGIPSVTSYPFIQALQIFEPDAKMCNFLLLHHLANFKKME
jgi:hypothetical protein